MLRRLFLSVCLIIPCWAADLKLPNREDSLRFAVIGDTGTGDDAQYEVAQKLAEYHAQFPFELVLMLGDNLYGGEGPRDYQNKFEIPYKPLLDKKVKFYAALGNHDDPNQSHYKLFNMNGERYYSFQAKNVRFFALDSNYMDKPQLEWLEKELSASRSQWKICFFHHPIYSSGERHGPDEELRSVLEPLFVKYAVDVVFSGHEHFYERLKPQKGIYYFICGSSAKLRKGNIRRTEVTAKGFDRDRTFMLVEITGDEMHFQAISRAGETVDSGFIKKPASVRPVSKRFE